MILKMVPLFLAALLSFEKNFTNLWTSISQLERVIVTQKSAHWNLNDTRNIFGCITMLHLMKHFVILVQKL